MSSIAAKPLTEARALAVKNDLWDVSRQELDAFGLGEDGVMAHSQIDKGYKMALVCDDGVVAITGGYPTDVPGVWRTWFVGSELFKKHWKATTRKVRAVMENVAAVEGVTQYVMHSRSAHPNAIRWFRLMGFFPQYKLGKTTVCCLDLEGG